MSDRANEDQNMETEDQTMNRGDQDELSTQDLDNVAGGVNATGAPGAVGSGKHSTGDGGRVGQGKHTLGTPGNPGQRGRNRT